MLLIATIPAVVALVGAVVYFASNGKASQAGLYAFACGLLVVLFIVGREVVKIG